jgi:hypothetical protein
MSGYAVAHVEPAGGSKPQASRLVAVIGLMLALAYLVLLGGAYLDGNFLTDIYDFVILAVAFLLRFALKHNLTASEIVALPLAGALILAFPCVKTQLGLRGGIDRDRPGGATRAHHDVTPSHHAITSAFPHAVAAHQKIFEDELPVAREQRSAARGAGDVAVFRGGVRFNAKQRVWRAAFGTIEV